MNHQSFPSTATASSLLECWPIRSTEDTTLICSHCSKTIRIDAIEQQRGKGFHAQICCPHCHAWLGRSAWLMRLKLVGFYLAFVMGGLAWWLPTYRPLGIMLGLLGLITLLVCHLMDQLIIIERPERIDDSSERQRYR